MEKMNAIPTYVRFSGKVAAVPDCVLAGGGRYTFEELEIIDDIDTLPTQLYFKKYAFNEKALDDYIDCYGQSVVQDALVNGKDITRFSFWRYPTYLD